MKGPAAFETLTQAKTTASNLESRQGRSRDHPGCEAAADGGYAAGTGTVLTPQHLVISIAAGVTTAKIIKWLDHADARVIRVMPNTPALVQAGASAFCVGGKATREDAALAQQLFASVGVAVETTEALLDAVTVSRQRPRVWIPDHRGPQRCGRASRPASRDCHPAGCPTLLGAAKMVLETGDHPGALKDAVTSPGGTTIAGIHEMEKGGVRAALMNAVVAATARATELGSSSMAFRGGQNIALKVPPNRWEATVRSIATLWACPSLQATEESVVSSMEASSCGSTVARIWRPPKSGWRF